MKEKDENLEWWRILNKELNEEEAKAPPTNSNVENKTNL